MDARSGLRVVIDARPLQAPDRNPTTALYLDALLAAFAAEPRSGESFLFLLDSPGPDPTGRYPGLPVAGRRRVPPTRRLRAATLTLDPFLLRAASLRVLLGRQPADAKGTVLHVTGGTLPIASGLPVAATLLDLAAWELPAVYQRSPAERFGQRLRARLLREAERIIVPSEATARATSRFLPFPRERIHVIRLAALLPPLGGDGEGQAEEAERLRRRLGIPDRYVLYRGQYDARKDLATLLRALADLGGSPPAKGGDEGDTPPWPPTVVLVPGNESDGWALTRLIEGAATGPNAIVTPTLAPLEEAALLRGARALVAPALVDGSGLPVIEAIAAGVPVVASSVGALPELVGKAGILVPPRDGRRLAAALAATWSDDRLHARLSRAAAKAAQVGRRSWKDVAAETRDVYTLAASRRRA